jgi:multidrug efflux pump subunit AcrB
MIDIWKPEGTHIKETEKVVSEIEKYVRSVKHVTSVSSFVGQGASRFLLVYSPEKPNTAYAQLLVDVDDWTVIDDLAVEVQNHLDNNFPDTLNVVKKFLLGPGEGGKIQIRLSGPDYDKLRSYASETMKIMEDDGGAKGIRSDWRQKVKTLVPVFSEAQARRTGIERQDLAKAIEEGFDGLTLGVYRQDDELLPIIARARENERKDVKNIGNLQIWSPTAQRMVPIRQVVSKFDVKWENPIIRRRNRRPTITVHCDQKSGNASVLLSRIKPKLDAIVLPEGYSLEYGGEYEDSRNAQAALASNIPAFLVMMVLVVVFLFNSVRQPLIIWLTVPLSVIGVSAGLLLTKQPFGFMALLGFLSLSGMLIKNAIVLIDEIKFQIGNGINPYSAVLDSSVSRMRPVAMAALTTVLGMMPLLTDAFFVSMAVTIMFGLTFACVLTLIVVPVLYAIFYKISSPK